MLWVKKDNHTYQSIGHNIHENKKTGKWEVWITRPTGQTSIMFEGDHEKALIIYSAMNYAIEKDMKLVEL